MPQGWGKKILIRSSCFILISLGWSQRVLGKLIYDVYDNDFKYEGKDVY